MQYHDVITKIHDTVRDKFHFYRWKHRLERYSAAYRLAVSRQNGLQLDTCCSYFNPLGTMELQMNHNCSQ